MADTHEINLYLKSVCDKINQKGDFKMKKYYWLLMVLGILAAWGVMAAILFFIWLVAPVFFTDFWWLLLGCSVVLAIIGGSIGVKARYDYEKKKEEAKKINP